MPGYCIARAHFLCLFLPRTLVSMRWCTQAFCPAVQAPTDRTSSAAPCVRFHQRNLAPVSRALLTRDGSVRTHPVSHPSAPRPLRSHATSSCLPIKAASFMLSAACTHVPARRRSSRPAAYTRRPPNAHQTPRKPLLGEPPSRPRPQARVKVSVDATPCTPHAPGKCHGTHV